MQTFNDLIQVADEVTDFAYQHSTVERLVSALNQDGKNSLARAIRDAAQAIGYWTWPADAPKIESKLEVLNGFTGDTQGAP